jgi:hypothetical protein
MERHFQAKNDLIKSLSEVKTDWQDAFSIKFLDFLALLPEKDQLDRNSIRRMLESDFKNAFLFFSFN